MKARILIATAVAAFALAACNNNGSEGGSAAADSNVKIAQIKPPPGGTWADVVNATPAGGYVMGNPDAKVKLVEIGSLFCPVCKRFEEQGVPTLVGKYVKSGQVSWEFRPYIIHGPIDMVADLIARCNGAKTFFPLSEAIFKDQADLLAKLEKAPPGKYAEIQNLPPDQAFVALASLMGMQDWAAARGLPQAKSNQCLVDQKMIDNEIQVMTDVNTQYPDFAGTPSFILNGQLLKNTASWDALQPQLDEALK